MADVNAEKRDSGAVFLLLAASLVIVIAGLRAAASLITPFLLAMFIALVSLPLLNGLQGLRLPRPLAVVVTLMAALGVLGVLVWVVTGSGDPATGGVGKSGESRGPFHSPSGRVGPQDRRGCPRNRPRRWK